MAAIGITGAKKIHLADGHVWLLFPVLVHIAEHEIETAIVVRSPALECWLYMAAFVISIGENTV